MLKNKYLFFVCSRFLAKINNPYNNMFANVVVLNAILGSVRSMSWLPSSSRVKTKNCGQGKGFEPKFSYVCVSGLSAEAVRFMVCVD